MAIERHFQVTVPDEDGVQMMTAGDIHRFLRVTVTKHEPSLDGPSARQWTEEEMWDSVRALIADHFAISPENITPATHLVHDLGL